MSKINDGGPAFPVVLQSQTDNGVTYYESLTGKSLRADFAGLAMQVLLEQLMTSPEYGARVRAMAGKGSSEAAVIASVSCAMADALIAELNKEPK